MIWEECFMKLKSKNILIAGDGSGVGKSHLAAELLKHLPGWSAVKLSVNRHENNQCLVTADLKDICIPGKDTMLFYASGARPVIWIKTDKAQVESGVDKARSLLTGVYGIIWEGNSLLDFISWDYIIYVTDGRVIDKDSAQKARAKADYIVNNSDKQPKKEDIWSILLKCTNFRNIFIGQS